MVDVHLEIFQFGTLTNSAAVNILEDTHVLKKLSIDSDVQPDL